MFLFSTLLFTVSGVGLTCFMKYNYPNLALSFMYQCVYYYSSLEMLYLKLYKHNFKRLTFTSASTPAIEFIKNGKPLDPDEEGDCHFMIYSQNNEKRIIKAAFKERTFIKSGVSFILFNIELNNTTISLKLSGDNYNYYLVGNVIDSRFLWYFLNKHYNLGLTEPITNYTLNVIDNNVNIYSIRYPECFEITPDGIRVFGKITNNMTFDQSETMTDVVIELVEKEPGVEERKECDKECDKESDKECDKECDKEGDIDKEQEVEELEKRKDDDMDAEEIKDAEKGDDDELDEDHEIMIL